MDLDIIIYFFIFMFLQNLYILSYFFNAWTRTQQWLVVIEVTYIKMIPTLDLQIKKKKQKEL